MHLSIKAEPIFNIGNFVVTNTLFTSWAVVLFIVIGSIIFSKKIKKIPGRFQALIEFVLEKFMDFMEGFAGDRALVRKFLPLVGTIFVYVLLSNWAGTLPGVETIGFHTLEDGKDVFVPLFRTVNSDINMTLVLALIIVISSHIVGLKSIGAKHHAGKFIVNPLKHPIGFFVGFLEIIGEFSRVISLTFRLFGNIFAGSVLMLIISFLAPFIVPIPFLGLELFVGFIQALVISVLAMMFVTSATKLHEEH
ncbi:MAG: F0F1 ATP synthase subunit A [Patescibacteria group bacterium]